MSKAISLAILGIGVSLLILVISMARKQAPQVGKK